MLGCQKVQKGLRQV